MAEAEHSQVRWVVSWPPPWVPVPMNVVTALPTSEPFCHSEPVASQNALNCAAGEPYLRFRQRDQTESGKDILGSVGNESWLPRRCNATATLGLDHDAQH